MSDITETSRSAPCKHEWMNMIGHTQGDGTSYDSCMLCGWIDTRKIRRHAFEEALEIVGEEEPIPDALPLGSPGRSPARRLRVKLGGRNDLRAEIRAKLREKLEELKK